jgi:hypothetical protein
MSDRNYNGTASRDVVRLGDNRCVKETVNILRLRSFLRFIRKWETAAVRDFYIGVLTHKLQYFMAVTRSKKLMLMPDCCTKTVIRRKC